MARIEKRSLKDGSARYKAIIRRKGIPMKTKTFRTRAQASAWAKRVEVKILDHRAIPTWEAEKRTVGELIDRYLEEVLPRKPRSQYEQTYQLRWWKEQIGSVPLAAVTPALVAQHKSRLAGGTTRRGAKRQPGTVNRYLAALSHTFTVASREWEWVDANPVRRVAKLKEPRGRERFLSDEERPRLLEVCQESRDPRLYPLVVLALATGARQGELLSLKWSDVNLDRRVAIVRQTKNDDIRALHIVGLARQALQELGKVRRIDTDLVFANASGNAYFPKKPWQRALEAAQIDDFRFHDLRHSAASYLAMSGATLAELAEVLGHKTLQMVKRYSHLTEQHVSKVVSRMNERIFGDQG